MRRQQGGELSRGVNFVTSINPDTLGRHSHHERPGEQHRLGCVALLRCKQPPRL
ncbi:hypothetical protein J3F84DRAFT_379383 [Trichoderma pleuroticola]